MNIRAEGERHEFMKRLHEALIKNGYKPGMYAEFHRNFNRVSAQRVTLNGARKWLIGEMIPAQPKIRALAQWLNVDPSWLRYGDEEKAHAEPPVVPARFMHVVQDLMKLDDHEVDAVHRVISCLLARRV